MYYISNKVTLLYKIKQLINLKIIFIFIISIIPIVVFATNQEFQDIVVFGDSLSDSGINGRYIPNGNLSYNYADIISQKLTNKDRLNPYNKAGTNYATSGALINFKNPLSYFIPSFYSINQQTSIYLENNKPSKDNMYIYWAGGWDIYFNMIYDSFIKLVTEFTFNSYPDYNNPLINISKKLFLEENTNSLISQVKAQFDNGAKYVAIFNIPNAGYTPAISFFHFDILSLITEPLLGINFTNLINHLGFDIDNTLRSLSNSQTNIGGSSIREFGFKSLKQQFKFLPDVFLYNYWDTLNAMATFYTNSYNKKLKESLLSLSNNNIIYLDIYKLFDEIIENPKQYGVDNIVLPACTLGVSSSNCYGDDYHQDVSYLFGDWFHPNVITHLGIANYFLSVFNAPVQVSSILKQMFGTNISRNLIVESNLQKARFNQDLNKIIPIFGISGNVNGKSYLNYADKNSFNQNLNFGFIYNLSENLSAGAIATIGFGKYKPYKTFNYNYNQKNISIFAQYLFENNIWINSQIGIAHLAVNKINRTIELNPKGKVTEQGQNTHAYNESLNLNIGYDYKFNQNYILSPIIGYTYEHYKLKGYQEKSNRSTAMNFSDTNKNNAYMFTGIEFNTRDYPINFVGQITYNKVFNTSPIKIKSSINSTTNKFEREIYLTDNHWISSKIGLSSIIAKKYNFNIYIEYRKDKTKTNKINYSIGLSKLF